MISASGANHTTSMQTKSSAATKIASRNQAWGFHGTVRSNLNLNDDQTAALFERAVCFTAERLDMNMDAARH